VARQHTAVAAWDPAMGALYDALATTTWDLARRKRAHLN
jgi:hypothetical protein